VQRALGWTGDDRRPIARCDACGAELTFDVPDPERLGRSMQQCSNRNCDGHTPHPMTRETR
jgi:hypothetical protein